MFSKLTPDSHNCFYNCILIQYNAMSLSIGKMQLDFSLIDNAYVEYTLHQQIGLLKIILHKVDFFSFLDCIFRTILGSYQNWT